MQTASKVLNVDNFIDNIIFRLTGLRLVKVYRQLLKNRLHIHVYSKNRLHI